MSRDDEAFMRRAIELARSSPFTSPNPKVGAVVVRDGAIIAEAAHKGAGLPHAEIDALAGIDARDATLYVNLEPCTHEGLTPPCAPALVDLGVRRVVAPIEDPDPRVCGKGFQYLRARGVEVVTGVLAREARALNSAYLHHRSTGSPFVSLKLALSLDGRVAARDGSSRWLTAEAARRVVHGRRAEVDAVMVGAGTVLADDPELTARDVPAVRQPARVLVDARGRVPAAAKALRPDAKTIVATTPLASHDVQVAWKEAGAEVMVLPAIDDRVDLVALLRQLGERGWLEVLCEGGPTLGSSLLALGLVDRLELHYAPLVLGAGRGAIDDIGIDTLAEAKRWRPTSTELLEEDVIVVLEPE